MGIELPTLRQRRKNKRNQLETYQFQWLNDIPLRDSKDALKVNWLSVCVTRENKTLYRNESPQYHWIKPRQ